MQVAVTEAAREGVRLTAAAERQAGRRKQQQRRATRSMTSKQRERAAAREKEERAAIRTAAAEERRRDKVAARADAQREAARKAAAVQQTMAAKREERQRAQRRQRQTDAWTQREYERVHGHLPGAGDMGTQIWWRPAWSRGRLGFNDVRAHARADAAPRATAARRPARGAGLSREHRLLRMARTIGADAMTAIAARGYERAGGALFLPLS